MSGGGWGGGIFTCTLLVVSKKVPAIYGDFDFFPQKPPILKIQVSLIASYTGPRCVSPTHPARQREVTNCPQFARATTGINHGCKGQLSKTRPPIWHHPRLRLRKTTPPPPTMRKEGTGRKDGKQQQKKKPST